MKTCEEIRRENLLTLIKEFNGEAALAEAYGCTEANIKTMARAYKDSKSGTPKGIGSAAARKLETIGHKERGWLDHDHEFLYSSHIRPTEALVAAEPSNVMHLPAKQHAAVAKIKAIIGEMNETGQSVLLYEAEKIAKQFPKVKANPAS